MGEVFHTILSGKEILRKKTSAISKQLGDTLMAQIVIGFGF